MAKLLKQRGRSAFSGYTHGKENGVTSTTAHDDVAMLPGVVVTSNADFEDLNCSCSRCNSPLHVLLCFLFGWVAFGTAGTTLYFSSRSPSFSRSSGVEAAIDVSMQNRPMIPKRPSLLEGSNAGRNHEEIRVWKLRDEDEKTSILEQKVDSNGIGIAPTLDRFKRYGAPTSQNHSGHNLGGGGMSGAVSTRVENTLLEFARLLRSKNVTFFLFGPTLQRYVGGSLGIDMSHPKQYIEAMHVGIWLSKNNLRDVRKVLYSLGFSSSNDVVGLSVGIPGDHIFLQEEKKAYTNAVFVSTFSYAKNYIWQGTRLSPKLSYKPFSLSHISVKLQKSKTTEMILVPRPAASIMWEQRGDLLAFGGHSARFQVPTLAKPANVVIPCINSTVYGKLNQFGREGKIFSPLAKEIYFYKQSGHLKIDIPVVERKKIAFTETKTDVVKSAYNSLANANDAVEYVKGTKFTFHKVQAGENLEDILQTYSIQREKFIKWNNLKSNNVLKNGEEFIVGVHFKKRRLRLTADTSLRSMTDSAQRSESFGREGHEIQINAHPNANKNTRKILINHNEKYYNKKRLFFVAKPGDSYESVAKQYKITAAALRSMNGISDLHSSTTMYSGETYEIIVPTLKLSSGPAGFQERERPIKATGVTDSAGIYICTDSCSTSHDGSCDDGGANSNNNFCSFGTDCSDCGHRSTGNTLRDNDKRLQGWSSKKKKAVKVAPEKQTRRVLKDKSNGVNVNGIIGSRPYMLDVPAQSTFSGNPKLNLLPEDWEGDKELFLYIEKKDQDNDLQDPMCNDMCKYANDGVCDDGGSKSKSQVCVVGSDCSDCGSRKIMTATSGTTDVRKNQVGVVESQYPFPSSNSKRVSSSDIVEEFLGEFFLFHVAAVDDTIIFLSQKYDISTFLFAQLNSLRVSDPLVEGTEYLIGKHTTTSTKRASGLNIFQSGVQRDNEIGHVSRSIKGKEKDLMLGATIPTELNLFKIGVAVFVKSDVDHFLNYWWKGKIVGESMGKDGILYRVQPVQSGGSISTKRDFAREDLVLDVPPQAKDLDAILATGNLVKENILIFGRISNTVGGWGSKLIGRDKNGKYVAETLTLKGLRTNSLDAKYFRVLENHGIKANTFTYIRYLRAASLQSLTLASNIIEELGVPHWLSGDTYSNWLKYCSIFPLNVGVDHRFFLSVHYFDWNTNIKLKLQNIGFKLVQENIFPKLNDTRKVQATQIIFSRPIFCISKKRNAESNGRQLPVDCGPEYEKYKNFFNIRLVIDIVQTRVFPFARKYLYWGEFGKTGNFIKFQSVPLFDLQWVDLYGWRFRLPAPPRKPHF
jgi:LysM repeat protein